MVGNLSGWIVTLGLLFALTSYQVVEGYAWLITLLCWNLVPLVYIGYGMLAGVKIITPRPLRPWWIITLWGFVLGASLWLVLGLFSALVVTILTKAQINII